MGHYGPPCPGIEAAITPEALAEALHAARMECMPLLNCDMTDHMTDARAILDRLAKRLPASASRSAPTTGTNVSSGSDGTSASAAGLKTAGSTRLPTNGARSVICPPLLQAAEAKAVKSPASIAAVGTYVTLWFGC